jgi:hypothetical protein
MRSTLFGAFVAACLAAMPLSSTPAHAMALPAPAALNDAADALNVTEKVYYGYGYGYGNRPWRPYYGYGYGYRPYYGYGYRPNYGYYRPFYRPVVYGPRFFYGGYRPYWGWGGPRWY